MEFQKLLPIEKVKNPERLFPALVSEKFDGVFCCYRDGKIYSRTGKEYTSMEHLKDILRKVESYVKVGCGWDRVEVLFEAYADVDQPTISGWCRDTENQHPEIYPQIHRVVNLDSLHQVITNGGFHLGGNEVIRAVEHRRVNSYKEAMRIAEEVWKHGGEGIVVDAFPVGKYQPGSRNMSCVKVKQSDTYDLKVIDLVEGEGKYAGMTGALLCQFGDGTEVTCGGMTDKERKDWWANRELIVGKIVEVACMKASTKGRLREPRFKKIRHDKNEPDMEV